MTAILLHLINTSITASWIVLAVILLRFVLKKAPKWICIVLWGIVAIRLLVPVSIENALSLVPREKTVSIEPVSYSQEMESDVDSLSERCERIVIDTGIPAVNNTLHMIMEPNTHRHANSVETIRTIACCVWLIGADAMLLYTLVSYVRLRHKVRASIKFDKGVYVCDEIQDPFILGLFIPKIYLPSSINQAALVNVLMHERAHLKRGDHIWKPLGFLLLSVYWFNPFLWVAYILFCHDIELACDEKVIHTLSDDGKASYSESLLSCSIMRRSLTACPLAFGAIGLKKRIRFVLQYRKPSPASTGISMLSCCLLAIGFLTVPIKPMIHPFPDITNEEQLYGTWTLYQMSYKTYADEEPALLKDLQINNRLHLTFYPDGVVLFLAESGHHEIVGRYEICPNNKITVWGKERIGKGNTVHIITAYYDPDADSLSLSPRAYVIEYFSRSQIAAPASKDGVPAEFHVQALSSYR